MYETLMEEAVQPDKVRLAYEAVIRNAGAAGIDRMSTKELGTHLQEHGEAIRNRLLRGEYVPAPVRRKEIEKPDGGRRRLGIPTVQDRFVQQLLVQVLTPIFDPTFSDHSYGFRPGRNAPAAVRAAQGFARAGKTWVVDIDISKFFDCVNHDILMRRIGQTIRDKRVLRLIGRYLRAGVLIEGVVVKSEEGTPQGGPLSPLLANIYLDAWDKELESRNHAFSRYADDCNIYVNSPAAAARTLRSVTEWLDKQLRLQTNAQKSGVGRVWERKFLGFQLNEQLQITVSAKSLQRFRQRVRQQWRSCQSQTSEGLRDDWRAYLRGWWGYYRLAEQRRNVFGLEGWIRRHIRKCFWLRWHNRAGRLNALRRLGVRGRALGMAGSSRGAWPVAKSRTLHQALSNRVLNRYGFLLPSELAAAVSPLGSTAGC